MQINRPTLFLNRDKCVRNIQKMANKAEKHKLCFRPHFKTHRSAEIANWFKSFGVSYCTVSNVDMAEYFAKNGFDDITISFPVNVLQLSKIEELAKIVNLNILIDSAETIEIIEKKSITSLQCFLEIDTGAYRTGVHYSNFEKIKQLCNIIDNSNNLILKGLLTHAGNTYLYSSRDLVSVVHIESVSSLVNLKRNLKFEKNILLSIGDTPSCSISDSFEGIDEIRPGNFVFYDVMQWQIGSCNIDDIAICLACPVVKIDLKNEKAVIWGGSAHLSKEFIELKGKIIYGLMVEFNSNGWELIDNAYVYSLSQEHGCLHIPKNFLKSISIGKILGILPIHSCSVVGLMRKYHIFGTNKVISTFHDNN